MSENTPNTATKQLLLFLRIIRAVDVSSSISLTAYLSGPSRKAQANGELRRSRAFTQLATSLLNPEVRMKTTLPVPSEALHIEAAQILATLGIDGLKPTPALVNKSKIASARTSSGQKDALVAKVQAEGMGQWKTAQTPTPATGMSALAITPTIPLLSHANKLLDNQAQYHTNPAEKRAPEGTESGGLSGVAMDEGDNATSRLPTMELDSQEIHMEYIDVRSDVGGPVVYGKTDGVAAGLDYRLPRLTAFDRTPKASPGVAPPQAVPNAASVADPVALPFQTPIAKKIRCTNDRYGPVQDDIFVFTYSSY
ncbi:hypothetical protein M422DRAFT_275390 [Sphaerobolus stellatus SS14]|uniref:Unplaced genomic scaffold SPHSTscaffold_484, whole genome shotgun sequence n=1 Tax=Sphaerobolus stellatus (strain SS14) TaxID=990650 RepID=A0A0C9U4C5_SPHS4|nr:hypothetical protein M422DRAFT_275390 [Sphaerobolus stellatus SS14]